MKTLKYTQAEKEAAFIIDRLTPVIVEHTGAHISPDLFNALVLRLSELEADGQPTKTTTQTQPTAHTPGPCRSLHTFSRYELLKASISEHLARLKEDRTVESMNISRENIAAVEHEIAIAVDSHAKLLRQNEELLAALELLDHAAGVYQAVVHTDGAGKALDQMRDAHKQARAAIASAKGVQS